MIDPTIIEAAEEALKDWVYDRKAQSAAQMVLAAVAPLIEAAALERAAKVAGEADRWREMLLKGEVERAVLAVVTPMIEAAALERAALIAETHFHYASSSITDQIAAAIRALKQEQSK